MVQKKNINFNFHKLLSIFGLSLITTTLFSTNIAFAAAGAVSYTHLTLPTNREV